MVGKISEMTAAAALTGAEQVEVVQSGANRRTTTGDIAALTPQKYRGLYVSLAALNAAVPTASAGDYADVDSGTGSNVKRYIWDTSDTAWVEQTGGGAGMANPMTTAGDLIVGGAAGVPNRLPVGATGKVLGVAAGSPAWVDPPASGTSLPAVRAITGNETLGLANINTFGVNATTDNYTSTIPAQATVAWDADAEMHFLTSNTGDQTITAAAGVSLNGVVAGSLTLSTQNGAATLKRTGADAWWLGGVIGTTAEQRTALGLGTASTANVTASATDTTAGALMSVGAFGLGGTGTAQMPSTGDANATAATGFYRLVSPFTNGPTATTYTIINTQHGSTIQQIALGTTTNPQVYTRAFAASTWSAWAEVFTSTGNNVIKVDTGSLGYGVGSGGTVTQATSKSTGVPLNKPSGQITTAADSLAANTAVSFTLTNNKIAANDVPSVVIKSGATAGAYVVQVDAVVAGSCRVSIRNMTAGALAEALVLQFNNEKGAIA